MTGQVPTLYIQDAIGDNGLVLATARLDLSRFKNVPLALRKQASGNSLDHFEAIYGKALVQQVKDQCRNEITPQKPLTSEQKAMIKAMEEQQKIRFTCPCGQNLRTNAENEGKTVKCPTCGETMTATREASAMAKPKSLADVIRLTNARRSAPIASVKTPKSLVDLMRMRH